MLPDAKVQKIKYKKIKAHLNPLFSINKELGRNQKKPPLHLHAHVSNKSGVTLIHQNLPT